MSERTPWAGLLQRAHAFALPPAAFWRLSVREWRALMKRQEEAMARDALQALMRAFPDDRR